MWLHECVDLRGDYAHGKLTNTRKNGMWRIGEHKLLAAIAFPLVLKFLLRKQGCYRFSKEDRIAVEVFERFADEKDILPISGNGSNTLVDLLESETDPARLKRCLRRLSALTVTRCR